MTGVLGPTQSVFSQRHSTITAVTSITNGIINALDNKKSCAALFIDLSKAFNTVDHHLLLQSLQSVGFRSTVSHFFSYYLSGRTQCVAVDNCTSFLSEVKQDKTNK